MNEKPGLVQGIDPKMREMIILRAAAVLDSPYEWQADAQMVKNLGLSRREIDAVASDGPVAGINHEYVLVCKATDELMPPVLRQTMLI